MTKNKRYIIGVTGTPGSGKSTFAKKLSKSINVKVIEINDIAIKNKFFSRIDSDKTHVLKIKPLDGYIKKMINDLNEPVILVGHIIPELTIDFDVIFIVRCPLKIILKRLQKRNYNKDKLRENILSEAFDYCNYNIKKRDCHIIEIESAKDKNNAIRAVKLHNFNSIIHLEKANDRNKELAVLIKKNMWLGL